MSLGANRLCLRVFVDGDLAVEDPPGLLVRSDDVAPKILHADIAVTGLRQRDLLNVNARVPARLCYPEQFTDDESVMLEELVVVVAVAEVAFTRTVRVKR